MVVEDDRHGVPERGRLLLKLARLVQDNHETIARLESIDTGKPLKQALSIVRAGTDGHKKVVFLLTDGEETGLLGAQAFIDNQKDYPFEVGRIINLEARGVRGPAMMFETGHPTDKIEMIILGAGESSRVRHDIKKVDPKTKRPLGLDGGALIGRQRGQS